MCHVTVEDYVPLEDDITYKFSNSTGKLVLEKMKINIFLPRLRMKSS